MPGSLLEQVEEETAAISSDRDGLLMVSGYAARLMLRGEARLPENPDWRQYSRITRALFTTDPAASGLDQTDLDFVSHRSQGSLLIPHRTLWEAIVEQDGVIVATSAERLQRADFWASLEPALKAAVAGRLDEVGFQLEDSGRLLPSFTSRFLATFRRVYIVGTARRIQDQSALAEAGGMEGLETQGGFHHPRLDSQPGPSSAASDSAGAGQGSVPLRADIQRRELQRRLGPSADQL